jgi:membrane protein implicated in regulation of membrane protease activity
MLTLYIALGLAGGGLILLSALGGIFGHGGHDHDSEFDLSHDADLTDGLNIDGDLHFDVDADVGSDLHLEADAHDGVNLADVLGSAHDSVEAAGQHAATAGFDIWLPFLSLRFWIYSAGAFGLTGILLTVMKASQEPMTLWLSLGTGLIIGFLAAWAFHALRKQEVSEGATLRDLLGKKAKVSVASAHGDPGKIRLEHNGNMIDMLALSMDGTDFDPGEEVFVIAIDGERAKVVRRGELFEE